ncbi:hypothetical protein MHYP_G00130160 [Metynnis hypsauchen]
METQKEEKPQQDASKPVNSLQELLQHQGLVDWPVTSEEHLENPAEFFSFTSSEQVYEYLKEQVPFPKHVPESLLEDFETLWARVKAHEDTLSHKQSRTPAKEQTPAPPEYYCVSLSEHTEQIHSQLQLSPAPLGQCAGRGLHAGAPIQLDLAGQCSAKAQISEALPCFDSSGDGGLVWGFGYYAY